MTGLVLGAATGPDLLYFKIPHMLDGMGILTGIVLLLVSLGFLCSPSYGAEWTQAFSSIESIPSKRLNRIVWGISGALFLSISLLKLCQYNSFQAHTDLAIFTNVCWNTAHGRLLKDSVKGLHSYLGDHFSPVLILFAPLMWIWPSGLMLQFAQSFLIALSIPAAYCLAKTYGHSKGLALLIPLLLITNPYFHRAASAYFEPSTLAVPAFLWAFTLWRRGQKNLAVLLALSTLTLKEDAPFALIGIGLYLVTRGKKQMWQGLLLVAVAATALFAVTQWIVPYFLPMTVKSRHLHLFSQFGSSYSEIITRMVKNPLPLLSALVWPPGKLITPFLLLFYAGFLPLGAPTSLIPTAAMLLPHQMAGHGDFGYQALSVHYAAFPLALVTWSACAGLGRLAPRLAEQLSLALAATGLVTACGLLVPSPYLTPVPLSPDNVRAADNILRQIPPEASVWAPTYFVAHLACRERIKTLTDREYLHRDWFDPDYLILDLKHWAFLSDGTKKDILRAFKAGTYAKTAEDRGIVLFKKR